MKVIFLDVDGELTYMGYENPETQDIDNSRVKRLARIVNESGAVIVLSSSWKSGYNKETGKKMRFYQALERELAKENLFIYDITDNIPGELERLKPEMTWKEITSLNTKHGTGRPAEIEKWLNTHLVTEYVILDDEPYEFHEYGEMAKHWVQPSFFDPNGGLNDEHVGQALKILSGNLNE